jgi:hypothetical protein
MATRITGEYDFTPQPRDRSKYSIEQAAKFRDFHSRNPLVYTELVRLAREAKATGKPRVGIQMLFEVVRWHFFLKTTDADFKLNNNYAAYYARLVMDREPDLDGIFNLRSSIADDYMDEEAAA